MPPKTTKTRPTPHQCKTSAKTLAKQNTSTRAKATAGRTMAKCRWRN